VLFAHLLGVAERLELSGIESGRDEPQLGVFSITNSKPLSIIFLAGCFENENLSKIVNPSIAYGALERTLCPRRRV
jgi:hypothetical protein